MRGDSPNFVLAQSLSDKDSALSLSGSSDLVGEKAFTDVHFFDEIRGAKGDVRLAVGAREASLERALSAAPANIGIILGQLSSCVADILEASGDPGLAVPAGTLSLEAYRFDRVTTIVRQRSDGTRLHFAEHDRYPVFQVLEAAALARDPRQPPWLSGEHPLAEQDRAEVLSLARRADQLHRVQGR